MPIFGWVLFDDLAINRECYRKLLKTVTKTIIKKLANIFISGYKIIKIF